MSVTLRVLGWWRRPADKYTELIVGLSDVVASIVNVPLDRVRVRISEIPAELWGIAGQPAAEVRAAEIAARAAVAGS